MAHLSTKVTWPWFVRLELLSDNGEIWLMSGQAKHDQISISSTQNMLSVGIMVWLSPLLPDVIHDFVFTLTRDERIREDDCKALPKWINIAPL